MGITLELRLRKGEPWISSLCEWSANSKKWYPISRDSMEIEGPLELQSNLFNALLTGLIATIKGSYSRKERKLRLVL